MLEVDKLTKAFPGKRAVSETVLNVEPGEITGFAPMVGKTTTLRMITGFLMPPLGAFDRWFGYANNVALRGAS